MGRADLLYTNQPFMEQDRERSWIKTFHSYSQSKREKRKSQNLFGAKKAFIRTFFIEVRQNWKDYSEAQSDFTD